jgi:hypothetical protein
LRTILDQYVWFAGKRNISRPQPFERGLFGRIDAADIGQRLARAAIGKDGRDPEHGREGLSNNQLFLRGSIDPLKYGSSVDAYLFLGYEPPCREEREEALHSFLE